MKNADCIIDPAPAVQPEFFVIENPALDAGFRERYAFDQKSSIP